jgi:hypothetical protein
MISGDKHMYIWRGRFLFNGQTQTMGVDPYEVGEYYLSRSAIWDAEFVSSNLNASFPQVRV